MGYKVAVRTLSWVGRTLQEAGILRRAVMFGRDEDAWRGATIDSRAECSQRIFFALKGDNVDGHRYAVEAHSRGSCAVVVDREDVVDDLTGSHAPFFLVDDSLAALQQLARVYRGTLDLRVIAVTGSNGKTTTKEYIRMIMRTQYKVHSNRGNLNNHIGVPITILDTDHESEYLVSEVAANHSGEIAFLAEILDPDVGVITNIGDAHIGLFGSREKIAKAKAELLLKIEPEGYAVLPGGDDFLDTLRESAECRVVTFGYGEENNFRVSAVAQEEDRITFEVNGQPMVVKSFGSYNLLNAAAAAAVADLCGIDLESVRHALANTEPMSGRALIHRANGIVVIDDSYNANPTSMRVSLDSLCGIEGKRRMAILGDMAELGSYEESQHRELGTYIANSCVDSVYWLGNDGDHVREGMGSCKKSIRLFDSMDDLCAVVEGELQPGDVVLVKASRASALDKVVQRLQEKVLAEKKD